MSNALFRAGYLPGLSDHDVAWHPLRLGLPERPCEIEVPHLTPVQMTDLAQRVRSASRAQLKSRPVSSIIRVIDQAVARLLDEHDPYRQQLDHLLPLVTGFDAEMVRINLHNYLRTFRSPQLQRFVTEDFDNPLLLDSFQPRVTGGWTHAVGPELMVHVWAGNVPALPLWSLVSGLLVKTGSIGKVASAEPVFASVFARLLAELEPGLAECLAVVWWQGGDAAQERHVFEQADLVLAYGGNTALQAMQRHVPVTTRFLPHGHKLSFGIVSRSALSVRRGQQVATQAALDIARHEQQGCYSPQAFYVQRGAELSPAEFAQRLASELMALAHKFPRRALTLEESAALATWREAHEWQAVQAGDVQVLGHAGQACSVVYRDPPIALKPGPLNRCVQVIAIDSLDEVPALVAPQRAYLQTAGLAASPEELLPLGRALADVGVTRICAIGQMTAPAAGWHHDGRFSLLDLVQMVDIEASTEAAAEHFTSYES